MRRQNLPRETPTVPAEITFYQHAPYATWDGGSAETWTARLLNPDALDASQLSYALVRVRLDRPIAQITRTTERDGTEKVRYVIQGGSAGSRRYRHADSLDDAQARILRWARRRFRHLAPEGPQSPEARYYDVNVWRVLEDGTTSARELRFTTSARAVTELLRGLRDADRLEFDHANVTIYADDPRTDPLAEPLDSVTADTWLERARPEVNP